MNTALCVLFVIVGCAVCAPVDNTTNTDMSPDRMQEIRQQFEKEQTEQKRKQSEEAFRQQLRQENQIQQENLHESTNTAGSGTAVVPGVPIIPTVPIVQTVGGTGAAVPVVPVMVSTTTTAAPVIQGRADETDQVLKAFSDLLQPRIGGNMIPKAPPAQPQQPVAAPVMQAPQPQYQPQFQQLGQFPAAGMTGGSYPMSGGYPMGGLGQPITIPMASIPLARADQTQQPQPQQQAGVLNNGQQLMVRDMHGNPSSVDQQALYNLYGNQAGGLPQQQPVYPGQGY